MGYDWRSEFEWSTTPTIHTHHAYKETKSSSEHAREACRKRRIADGHLVAQSERVRPQRERRGGLAQLEYRRGVDVAHQGPPAGACEAVRGKRAVCEHGPHGRHKEHGIRPQYQRASDSSLPWKAWHCLLEPCSLQQQHRTDGCLYQLRSRQK